MFQIITRFVLGGVVCSAALLLLAIIIWWGWAYTSRGQAQAMAGLPMTCVLTRRFSCWA